MGRILRMKDRQQFIDAIGVLNELPGTWHSRDDNGTVVLMVLDSHYEALASAGVLQINGKKGHGNVQKTKRKTADA